MTLSRIRSGRSTPKELCRRGRKNLTSMIENPSVGGFYYLPQLPLFSNSYHYWVIKLCSVLLIVCWSALGTIGSFFGTVPSDSVCSNLLVPWGVIRVLLLDYSHFSSKILARVWMSELYGVSVAKASSRRFCQLCKYLSVSGYLCNRKIIMYHLSHILCRGTLSGGGH